MNITVLLHVALMPSVCLVFNCLGKIEELEQISLELYVVPRKLMTHSVQLPSSGA